MVSGTDFLNAPGVLHHVMVQGMGERPLFRDEADRRDFLTRPAGVGAQLVVRLVM